MPIIPKVVRSGSIIHTDEFASYAELGKNFNYEHHTVCHKYQFRDYVNNVDTQAVESFNNKLKLAIKERKGVIDYKREDFLTEFLWYSMYNSSNVDEFF